MGKDRRTVFVWSSLLVTLNWAGILVESEDYICWSSVGIGSHWSFIARVDVMRLKRPVPLIVTRNQNFRWPNLFDTALTLFSNELDSCWIAHQHLFTGMTQAFPLRFRGFNFEILRTTRIHGIRLVKVGSKQIELTCLPRNKRCWVNYFFKVLTSFIRLNIGLSFSPNNITCIHTLPFLYEWLCWITYKHLYIWI